MEPLCLAAAALVSAGEVQVFAALGVPGSQVAERMLVIDALDELKSYTFDYRNVRFALTNH